jgi:PadR family transcriptional regulator, regulatory protein PadR
MNAEMLKGHLDNILLAVLESGPAHGYAMIEAIRQRSDGSFDLPEGTIYPALHRLEVAGLLKSRWNEPPTGRKRRIYELTRAGTDALADRRDSWSRFSNAVDALLEGRTCPA